MKANIETQKQATQCSLSNHEIEIYKWYDDPINKEFREDLFDLLNEITLMKVMVDNIKLENEIPNLSREYGLFLIRLNTIRVEIREERDNEYELQQQKKKNETMKKLKLGLEILWKGVIVYFGLSKD